MLKADRGLWIDCDVLCLRPIADARHIFGVEDEQNINSAILKLPAEDPVLDDLMAIFTERGWMPPWASRWQRLRYTLRHRFEPGFGVADMSWGMTGPRALTWYLRQRGLADLAAPIEVFYPIGCHEMHLLTEADVSQAKARITPKTACVHIWNQSLAKAGPPQRGSLVSRIFDGSWRADLDLAPATPAEQATRLRAASECSAMISRAGPALP